MKPSINYPSYQLFVTIITIIFPLEQPLICNKEKPPTVTVGASLWRIAVIL